MVHSGCNIAVLAAVLLAAGCHAQMQLTNNLAFNSPLLSRPDLGMMEPQHAQQLGRQLARAFRGGRHLLQGSSPNQGWGKPTADSDTVFPQGVASGDPTADAVILWTRVPGTGAAAVQVQWAVARDPELKNIAKTGDAVTSAEVDYTVKVDATGLQPNNVYYYQFRSGNSLSPIGRTKTFPKPDDDKVQKANFAVASCSWFAFGYFNAYKTIAEFADQGRVDAMMHLGDYIYEYNSTSQLPAGEENRAHKPAKEIVTLEDYRGRHNQYDSDVDLKRMRGSVPLITVWDDHEFANNAWRFGAQNHGNNAATSATEQEIPFLPWEERANNAIRAYYEYMPIRQVDPDDKDRIYRKFQYGKLANLMMVDTRFYGRDQEYGPPTYNITSYERIYNTSRSMLGTSQRKWLRNELLQSQQDGVTWKVMGNQVFFSQRITSSRSGISTDSWDGYNIEREHILQTIEQHDIKNFLVLTGDVHASYATDIAREPNKPYFEPTDAGYDPATGKGSLGVEMVCNSVTSGPRTDCAAQSYDNDFKSRNRHIKYVQSRFKGFLYLELSQQEAAGTWVDMSTVLSRTYTVTYSDTMVAKAGANYLEFITSYHRLRGHSLKAVAPPTLLLPATGATAGALGVLCSSLAVSAALPRLLHALGVILPRRDDVIYGAGKGTDAEEWEQHIRAHANAAEHVPIFLIMMGAMEVNKLLTTPQLVAMGAVFTAARTIHSAQLAKPKVVPGILRIPAFWVQAGICLGAGFTLLTKCAEYCARET